MSEGTRVYRTLCFLLMAGATACQQPVLPLVSGELNTQLIEAARSNDRERLTLLLKQGAAPDLLGNTAESSLTPLFIASEEGHVDIVDALLDAGADPNQREGRANFGNTPLMVAARRGHSKVMDRLMRAGANVHARSGPFQTHGEGAVGAGYTALDQAVAYGHEEASRLLLLAGASVNQGNLYSAITNERVGILRLVLMAGADPTAPFPWNGRTPAQEAEHATPDARAAMIALLGQVAKGSGASVDGEGDHRDDKGRPVR